ncbi:MAG: hypothetical protein NXI31_06475 [bacterium]|nr:hypothetical protein [bacterium]
MTQLISLDPYPPVQGQAVKICYTFEGGVTSVSITVSFSPSGPTSTHTLTPSDNCVTIGVPNDAEDITVVDNSGASPNKESIILAG